MGVGCQARSLKFRAKLVERYVLPVLIYGLNTIVLRVRDIARLESVMNTACRIMLGIHSRRELEVTELRRRVPLPDVNAVILGQHVNLMRWVSKLGRGKDLLKRILLNRPLEGWARHPRVDTC